jgi:hypothetical protein
MSAVARPAEVPSGTGALSISLMRGPLSDEGLAAIAATYGSVDRRYADRDFCRVAFNENPCGYSFHAFVRDGDAVVGHYALIPMRTRARGATVISGKAEGLFLAESHRRSVVPTPEGNIPTALAMMEAVHERALADGLAVIHAITSPAIGMMQRMTGLRELTVSFDQRVFLIAPPRHGTYRAAGAQLMSVAQRALLTGVRAGLRLKGAPAVEVNPPEHAERHLAALAATNPAASDTWAVSRDIETLRWLRSLGRLDVVSVAGRPDHFAVVSTGSSRELLLWNVPGGAIRSGLAIACALLTHAIQGGASVVTANPELAAAGGASLGFALRILAFLRRRTPIVIYARSADPFYLQSANVGFSRVFNL